MRHRPPELDLPRGAVRATLALAAAVVVLTVAAGCRFAVLGRHLETLGGRGYLRGTVSSGSVGSSGSLESIGSAGSVEATGPLVVFAVPIGDPGGVAADWVVLSRPGPFFLAVPVGQYRIGAFADLDHSLTVDAGEPAGWVQGGAPVTVDRGEITRDLDLTLGATAPEPPIQVTLPARTSAGLDELPASRIGELVTIDDERFSAAAASSGLWRPVEFLVDVGAGIYFLEPYDPHRTPVLFVHGALGHPGNFRRLIASLDRRRFQAWVAYYPSAVRLEVVGAALGRWLQALELEYGFVRLGLVAHSMGGLVSRAYLAEDPAGLAGTLESLAFVSIATPWQGHGGAALGVAHAPVVAPAWFDLAPGGPFLQWLLASPLPRHAVQDVYFAFGGSRFGRTANDGVVTVASQLDPRVQEQARRLFGFDEGHAAVLDSPAVAEELERSLAVVEPPS